MIKAEQKELADCIKQVHLSLRRKSQQIGAEAAWKEHLEKDDILRNYAFAMKKLAQEFWSVNNKSNDSILLCRIHWIVNNIVDYYQKGGIEKELEKEKTKLARFYEKKLIDIRTLECFRGRQVTQAPYKVLDVGSCYNPFGQFEFLQVYPIDLYPASCEVKRCNFLEVDIKNTQNTNWFQDNMLEAPCDFFDVVVFSLFLEYLPSPRQRYDACLKAYHALKTNGILLIATPDSKHASANSKLMKSWKIGAGEIGFVRTKLEKLKYLYCMCFRKPSSLQYSHLVSNVGRETNAKDMFAIPQDTVEYNTKEEENLSLPKPGNKDLFEELPFC